MSVCALLRMCNPKQAFLEVVWFFCGGLFVLGFFGGEGVCIFLLSIPIPRAHSELMASGLISSLPRYVT